MHEPGKGRLHPGMERRIRPQRAGWMRAALARCEPFAALDDAALDAIERVSSVLKLPRRGSLYEQGSPANSLYVVVSGRVRVVRAGADNRALTVAYSLPGELLGETALSDGGGYRSTATATESVEAVQIPLRTVLSFLVEQPAFAQRMLALMVDRRIEAERRVESLLSRSVESRVAEFLVAAVDRNGVADARGVLIDVRYTHQEIADYIGSTRETVTLTLGELRRQELVTFDHRRIIVTSPAGLAKRI